ncbi:MAG: hypothetical protein ACRD0K_25490 [Egibacteraceae bacterium]
MLETDARRIAAAIEERMTIGDAGEAAEVTVETDRTVPNVVPAGAGRPVFIRYYIQISDATRVAILNLDEAAAVLDELEPDCTPDRLFEAVGAHGVRIEGTVR